MSFIPGAKKRRIKPTRIVHYEDEMYKYVAAKLLTSRGKVYMFKSIEGLVPDFVVDGGIWRTIVEVKTHLTRRDLEQIEAYSQMGEVCVALPKNSSPRTAPCYLFIDVIYIPSYEHKVARSRSEEEVQERVEEVS